MFFVCRSLFLLAIGATFSVSTLAQGKGKPISNNLFGLFFEDINYAADGVLYAELIQNRSFEYSPTDRKEWHSFSFWQYITPGFAYGKVEVATTEPLHANNPHYLELTIEHVGDSGVGLKNSGFNYIPVKTGESYDFSVFAKQLHHSGPIELQVSLQQPNGTVLASAMLRTNSASWTKYSTTLLAAASSDSASLVVLATTKGKLGLDMISLFPVNTFRKRPNGLRADLAGALEALQPKFIRFPGGCLVHGDGLGNMYRWKNTIGPIEERVAQKNIWGYHQTGGLGYFEYFQFCEDIGAKPVPVLPAAVSCQNSGGTWRIGGTGQQAIAMNEMADYIQEVLDLIEWANGPANSTWGAKRAAAGHPEPFNLEYIGIGNEDKITPAFTERFTMIYEAVKAKHPEITVIGTVGPFSSGEDYEKGWQLARSEQVPMVDEHYYDQPRWFIGNQYRYDAYSRKESGVYIGEYASWGNKMGNALAEALYMTGMERNGDIVKMASYAPLLAKKGFTQWNPNMIYFTNTTVEPTVNYYVQQLFSTNQGNIYYDKIIQFTKTDSSLAASCVADSKTGDIILKLVNATNAVQPATLRLSDFRKLSAMASRIELTDALPTPVTTAMKIAANSKIELPPLSVTVIRIPASGKNKVSAPVYTKSKRATNPIIFADVPDLSMIRVGNNYYMSSTTMHMSPGVPIMKSTDLVNWKLIGYAYDTLANKDEMNLNNGKSTYGRGSWASSLQYHKGIFYVTTFAQTTGRTHIYSTKDIEKGPWKSWSFPPSLHDHSLFFDDDGKVYLLYGNGKLILVELEADVSGIKEGGINQVVIENASAPAGDQIGLGAEGSQLYKINGYYYLFNITWPKGGMRTVVIHRARSITGPWEGRVGLQDLGVAQGGLISTPDARWFAYLFRDFGAVGRIPYLVPVEWKDNWPVLGENGKVPIQLALPSNQSLMPGIVASDEFDRKKGEPALPLVWQWNHQPDNALWSVSDRKGFLRLTTGRVDTSFLQARNTLTQRTFGPMSTATTLLDVSGMKDGDYAGLCLLQKNFGQLGVQVRGSSKTIVYINASTGQPEEEAAIPLNQQTVYLKTVCDFREKTDTAHFYYSLDGRQWTAIGNRLKMAYTLPHFMGYRFGLFYYATKTLGGRADFDYFRLE